MKTLLALFIALISTSLHAVEVGEIATCVILDGFTSKGEAHTGCIRDRENKQQKFTVIEFALTDCEACNESMKETNFVAETAAKAATTRTVYADSDETTVMEFLQTHQGDIKFATALDLKKEALRAYGVSVLPVVFVLDKGNKVVFKHEGLVTHEVSEGIVKLVQAEE